MGKTPSKHKRKPEREALLEPIEQSARSKSKKHIQADNEAKSDELEMLETDYRNLNAVVKQLNSKYRRSRWKLTRYWRLKRMIKWCTSENAVRDANTEGATESEAVRRGSAREFMENVERLARQRQELHETKKKEFVEKNIKLESQIKTEREKYNSLDTGIKTLKEDYKACKGYNFLQKYPMMKKMIKSMLQEASLQE